VITAVALNPVTSVVDNHVQPASGPTPPAVQTDLPTSQAVNSAANIPATGNDTRKPEKSPPGASRVVIIDPQTQTVVYRSLDAYTGRVIEQVPSQALLRQRAYDDAQTVQALIQGKTVSPAALAAAPEVDTTT
jgi:hypothetical protein